MSSAADRLAEVRAVFDVVADLKGAERDAAIERHCAGDGVLLREVRALLGEHDGAGAFLEKPAVLDGLAGEGDWAEGGLVGTTIGPFAVTGLLGRGGMGVVYRAEQARPRRTVALKLVRSALPSAEVLRRFEHESQVLARLRHPAIAQVYEAGTLELPGPGVGGGGSRVPYFAMELVEGPPLLDFVARRNPPLRTRLALFARVCDAVEHAHQRGVVHRDLKPANILVEEAPSTVSGHAPPIAADRATAGASGSLDGLEGPLAGLSPKVLDFGVARVTDPDHAVTTMQTGVGQVIGTVQYMSPEQVRGESGAADTRSDVYALGVVLFELLTGAHPYELSGQTLAMAARTITEHEPRRLGSLNRALRGDLETIVGKALEKDPDRRYPSAGMLGADVRRFILDLPIMARPPSAAYQVRKFARRNKALVGGVVATFAVLVAGIFGVSTALLRARAAEAVAVERARETAAALKLAEEREAKANTEAAKAGRTLDFLVRVLTSAAPEETGGKEVTVRQLLDAAAAKVEGELATEPAVRAAVRRAVGKTYLSIGRTEEALRHMSAAEEFAVESAGPGSLEWAEAHFESACVLLAERRWLEGGEMVGSALGVFREKAPDPDVRTARAMSQMGMAMAAQRKYGEAIELARGAIEMFSRLGRAETDEVAETMRYLGLVLGRKGGVAEVADGERTLKGAVELKRKLFGSDGVRYAAAVADLAGFYSTQARMAESLPLFEEAIAIESRVFGENDRRVLERLGGLARVYQVLGDNARAEATAQRGLSGLVAAGLGTTAEAGAAWSRLGSIAAARKDYAVAVERHQKAVEIRRGLKHPDLSTSLGFLGECLAALGRDEEALAHMAESIAIDRGAGFPKADASNGFVPYAALLEKLGRVGDAEKALAEALSISRVRLADHPWRATQEVAMGRLLVRRDRHAEAAACFKAAVEILKARRAGKVEEVEALLREAEEKAGAKAAAPG